MTIDTLAKTYNYTHDQVAELSVSEALTYLLYNKQLDSVSSSMQAIAKELEKTKK